jgi:hypothetical protein
MDSSTIKNMAAASVAPTVLKNFKLRWVFFGVAAYYGLKLLNKKGVLPKQTDAALGFIDQGIDMAKEKMGFSSSSVSSTASTPAKVHADAPSIH